MGKHTGAPKREEPQLRSISRREILKGVAALGALSALAACGPTVTPAAPAKTEPAKAAPTTNSSQTTPAAAATQSVCPAAGSATTLTGAGATFPNPLYVKWFDEYAKSCNVKVNYQAIGSGGGIQQHTKKLVDFGASDGILTEKQKQEAPGTLMIPMTAGAVAVVVNLEGVEAGKLKLSPEALAGIYLGTITKWDDAKVAADNPGLKLPASAITVARRADGSGTTNIFTSYLAAVSPDWKSMVGAGNAVQWPTGIGGEGNAGVAGAVKQKTGSIGYVELAYAKQNKLTWVALKNQSGAFVEPTLDATTAAMEGVTIPDSTEVMIVNSANPKAYPIAGFTWILAYADQTDKAKAQSLVSLLWWALHDGQKFTTDLDYAALSPAAVTKAEALVKSIKTGGEPVLK
jgi:phosphate transport system substrate-binding protein